MARPKMYVIILSNEDVKRLKSILRKKATSKTIRSRCQVLLDLDEAHGKPMTHEQSAKSNGICMATVTNIVKDYSVGGIDAVITYNRSVNSDNAKRKLDGRAEARLIEIACGPVPEGHSRWTLRLLAVFFASTFSSKLQVVFPHFCNGEIPHFCKAEIQHYSMLNFSMQANLIVS